MATKSPAPATTVAQRPSGASWVEPPPVENKTLETWPTGKQMAWAAGVISQEAKGEVVWDAKTVKKMWKLFPATEKKWEGTKGMIFSLYLLAGS